MSESLARSLIQSSFTAVIPAALILLLTWLIGHRFTYRWGVRRKRREAQLAALQQFYVAYGEFFAVWKLWNRLEPAEQENGEKQWELHKRAAAAEAIVEGLLVRLATELILTGQDENTLGCFRHSFQKLRQSIRRKEILPWVKSESTQYVAFKCLAVEVSLLLNGEWPNRKLPPPDTARRQFLKITSNEWEGKWMDHGSAD
jgi:hypothetical protein